MEKTIIINIGNTIIHIEESAYEVLKVYLTEVKQYFSNHADDLEIVRDIENRIAELLSELLEEQKKQVVDIAIVNAVIAQMGRVQDFETGAEEEQEPVATPNFQYQSGDKKLYRDMDERVIAGVCAGIAHYVDVEAKWIRVLAILSLFAGGFGLLVYAILWIIMPKANSRIEKMEMKGEAANLQGFQKNLDEELQAVKDRLNAVNKHAQPIFARLGDVIAEFFQWLGKFISGTGKIIFKVIAVIIVVFGIGFLLFLIISSAFFLGFNDGNMYDYFPFSIINYDYRNTMLLAAFIVLFIPILALVLFSIRVAFSKQAINKTLSYALLVIWLTGVAFTFYYVAKISTEFKEHAEISQTNEIKTYPSYTLDMDRSRNFSKEDSVSFHIGPNSFNNRIIVDNDHDNIFVPPNRLRINIEKSDNDKTTLVQSYESQGKNYKIALENAQNIKYEFAQIEDRLIFNSKFQITKGMNWRGQSVEVTLKIPVGTKLILKESTYRYINSYYAWSCDDEVENDFSVWVMTEEGLKCKYLLDHPEKNKGEE